MKFIKSFLIVMIIIFITSDAEAHQPDISSTMLVEQAADKWLVQIRAALTAFEYVINENHGADAYDSPEQFQQLVLNHISDNLKIIANNKKINILNGYVKLGHESSVVFQLESFPSDIESIEITNTSFVNISRNRNALMIHKKDIKPEQYILNSENDHTAVLKYRENKFIRTDQITKSNSTKLASIRRYNIQIILGAIILLVLGLIVLIKKSKSVIS